MGLRIVLYCLLRDVWRKHAVQLGRLYFIAAVMSLVCANCPRFYGPKDG